MNIKEYVEARIAELQAMQAQYESNHEFLPDEWPVEMDEHEWFEQELAYIAVEYERVG